MKIKLSLIAIAILISFQQVAAQSVCNCIFCRNSDSQTWKAITVKKKYTIQQVQRGWLSHTSITKYYIVGKDNKAYIVNRVEDWMVCEVGGIMWTDNGTSAQIKKRQYEFSGD
jgi:hypothetical protein